MTVGRTTTHKVYPSFNTHSIVRAVETSILLLVATLLFAPVMSWVGTQLLQTEHRLHLLASLGFLLACFYRLYTHRVHFEYVMHNPVATGFVCLSSLGFVLNERFLGLEALSTGLFLGFLFGMLGHVLSRPNWLACTWPILLAVFVLPFEGYLDIFLGFPLRLASADVTVQILASFGLQSVTTDSVLFIDNQAAIVDLDCSGIKGVWIGCIFFFAVTWVENYKLNAPWALVAMLTLLLIFTANVLRICALVILDLTLYRPDLAQLTHESLGLIGFTFSLAVGWFLLRRFGQIRKQNTASLVKTIPKETSVVSTHKVSLIVYLLMLFGFSAQGADTKTHTQQIQHIAFTNTQQIAFTEQTLTTEEHDFFVKNEASVKKYDLSIQFENQSYSASMLLVLSRDWKAHHIPTNCYAAQGYKITSSEVQSVTASQHGDSFFPVRHLTLQTSDPLSNSKQQFIGDYWFQSNQKITPNFSSRVITQLMRPNKPWSMVSVMWEASVPAQARQQLLTQLRETIEQEMDLL